MVSKKFKGLFNSKEFLLLVALFIFILLAMNVGNYWGTYKLNEGYISNFYLDSFDRKVTAGSDFCFTVVDETERLVEHGGYLLIHVNGELIQGDKVKVKSEKNELGVHYGKLEKTLCYNSDILKEGDNRINIALSSEELFFHIEKVDYFAPAKYSLDILDSNAEGILIGINLEDYHKFGPVKIMVNGELDHKIYPTNGESIYFEKLNLDEGKNNVVVTFETVEKSTEIEFIPQEKMNPLLGAILFVFGFFVFSFLVFSREDFVKKIMLSMASLFIIIILLGFILNLTGALSLVSFITMFLIIHIVLLFLFWKRFKFTKLKKSEIANLKNPVILLVIVGAILIPLVFNVFVVSNYSYWNVYYERQATSLAEDFTLPEFDELSYLGRPLGFIPGYFFLEAGMSWIFGLSGVLLFAVTLCLANLFFLFAVFAFGKTLGLSNVKIAMFYAFLWTENFIRGALVISPRHALSLSLFLVALTLLIMNRRKIFSGMSLGIAAFIQAPMLAAFPLLYIIVAKKIEWRKLLHTLIIAAVFFGLMLLPNLLNAGMLTQAETSNWGYLINYDPVNIFLDIGPILIFFIVFTLWDMFKRDSEWDAYKLKLFIAAILGLAFQIFISYRWNIFNTINIALFIVMFIPDIATKSKYFIRLFAVLLLLVGIVTAMGIGMLTISNYQLAPYDYLSENTSTGDNILTDPLFGHDIAYISERKILADLAVEYAPEGKLLDSYNFLEDKNYAVLKKYDISWTVNQSYMINRKAFGNKLVNDPIEFEKLDKVFANNLIYIHWVGD